MKNKDDDVNAFVGMPTDDIRRLRDKLQNLWDKRELFGNRPAQQLISKYGSKLWQAEPEPVRNEFGITTDWNKRSPLASVRDQYHKDIDRPGKKHQERALKILRARPEILKGSYERAMPARENLGHYELPGGHELIKEYEGEDGEDGWSSHYSLRRGSYNLGDIEIGHTPKGGIVKGMFLHAAKGRGIAPHVYQTLSHIHNGLRSDDGSTSDDAYRVWKRLERQGLATPIINKFGNVEKNSTGQPRYKMLHHNIESTLERLRKLDKLRKNDRAS